MLPKLENLAFLKAFVIENVTLNFCVCTVIATNFVEDCQNRLLTDVNSFEYKIRTRYFIVFLKSNAHRLIAFVSQFLILFFQEQQANDHRITLYTTPIFPKQTLKAGNMCSNNYNIR